MKNLFTVLLCLLPFGLLSQSELSQEVSIDVKDAELSEVILDLCDQLDINVSFSSRLFRGRKKVAIFVEQEPLNEVLNQLFTDYDLAYRWKNDGLTIFKKPSKRISLSGYVSDRRTGEQLIGAHIYDVQNAEGTITNGYGFFSYDFVEGQRTFAVSYLGYISDSLQINLTKGEQVSIALKPNAEIEEIVVLGNQFREIGLVETPLLNQANLQQVSSIGDPDVLRSVHLLNGVQASQDGLAGLHVRGGSSDQNLLLLDDVPIFNGAHSFGLFSVFNPNIVKNIKVMKGAYPSEYDGRLSSIVDVRTREGNTEKVAGGIDLSNLMVNGYLEFPIVKGKGGLLLAGRTMNIDPWLEEQNEETATDQLTVASKFRFYDVNAKAHYSPNKKDKLYLSYYQGSDSYRNSIVLETEDSYLFEGYPVNETYDFYNYLDLSWSNRIISARWNHAFGEKLFANTTMTYSKFSYAYDNLGVTDTNLSLESQTARITNALRRLYDSSISDFSGKVDFDYSLNHRHFIEFGANFNGRKFLPGLQNASVSSDSLSTISTAVIKEDFLDADVDLDSWNPLFESLGGSINIGNEAREIRTRQLDLYVDETYTRGALKLEAGLRASAYREDSWDFVKFQPRLAFALEIGKTLRLQGSAVHRAQFIHLLTSADSGRPNDIWVPATEIARPQEVNLFTLGVFGEISDNIDWHVEAYWKDMSQLIRLRTPDNFGGVEDIVSTVFNISPTEWQSALQTGSGQSKGVEFWVERNAAIYRAALGYSLSETTRTFDNLTSPFAFDSRHSITFHNNFRLGKLFECSATWFFESGKPNARDFYSFESAPYVYVFEDDQEVTFGDRLPAYHRLDVSARLLFGKRKQHHCQLGFYNIYNQRNVFFLSRFDSENDAGQSSFVDATHYSLPFLPSFSLGLHW